MKQVFVAVAVLVVALLVSTSMSAQSLGEIARKNRQKNKPQAEKVYTNDNLPKTATISTVGQAAPEAEPAEGKEAAAGEAKPAEGAEGEAADKEADSKDAEKEWRQKAADQKQAVADLEREINLLEREHQVQVATFYADAGNRLRNDREWADKERAFNEQLEQKKQQLEQEKQKLDALREEARKAGVPAGWVE